MAQCAAKRCDAATGRCTCAPARARMLPRRPVPAAPSVPAPTPAPPGPPVVAPPGAGGPALRRTRPLPVRVSADGSARARSRPVTFAQNLVLFADVDTGAVATTDRVPGSAEGRAVSPARAVDQV